jgi:electron transfer flavoprotein beta subunit
MKILACIKQVPDMESRFKVNPDGNWFEESDLAFRINEYDEFAVEQAVQLKEQLGGTSDVTVLSVGPDRVLEALKKSLAMGCDRGVHILDPVSYAKDPWQIASIIAAFTRGNNFDLIFTGMQSEDRGSAQVGVTIAELLGIPCATTLVGFSYDNGVITAKRELEGMIRGVVKLKPPALLTCQLGLNVPRYPTLPNILKARKKEIITIPVSELLRVEELTSTSTVYHPVKRVGCTVLEGGVDDMADRLINILREKTTVLS